MENIGIIAEGKMSIQTLMQEKMNMIIKKLKVRKL